MKKRVIGRLIGAIALAAALLSACTAPAWGPAEQEELGQPQLVGAAARGRGLEVSVCQWRSKLPSWLRQLDRPSRQARPGSPRSGP